MSEITDTTLCECGYVRDEHDPSDNGCTVDDCPCFCFDAAPDTEGETPSECAKAGFHLLGCACSENKLRATVARLTAERDALKRELRSLNTTLSAYLEAENARLEAEADRD